MLYCIWFCFWNLIYDDIIPLDNPFIGITLYPYIVYTHHSGMLPIKKHPKVSQVSGNRCNSMINKGKTWSLALYFGGAFKHFNYMFIPSWKKRIQFDEHIFGLKPPSSWRCFQHRYRLRGCEKRDETTKWRWNMVELMGCWMFFSP